MTNKMQLFWLIFLKQNRRVLLYIPTILWGPLNFGCAAVAYPGILFGRGGSTNLVENRGQRERGSGGDSPLVRGSGGSCNLVHEISFYIIKFS
jgi:hypothetical protein